MQIIKDISDNSQCAGRMWVTLTPVLSPRAGWKTFLVILSSSVNFGPRNSHAGKCARSVRGEWPFVHIACRLSGGSWATNGEARMNDWVEMPQVRYVLSLSEACQDPLILLSVVVIFHAINPVLLIRDLASASHIWYTVHVPFTRKKHNPGFDTK